MVKKKSISNEKRNGYLLFILILLISLFVYKDFIFGKNVFIYKDIGSDTYNQFYPALSHISNYLRTAGIPKWSFSQGMGQNIFPGGINDPFNLILYLFASDNIPYLLACVQILKIMSGGMIFFFYLQTIRLTPYACLVGGLLYSFLGYMILGGGWYGHASWVVYFAFLLFSFEKLFIKRIWLYFPLSVAIISADFFQIYISSVFLLLYSIFRYIDVHGFKFKGISKLLLMMTLLGILGLAMNAVFIISPLLQMINSPRVLGESGLFKSLKSSSVFGFAELLEYATIIMRTFSSDLLGTGSGFRGWVNYLEAPIFYSGILTLLLIPQVFNFLDRRRKIAYGTFLGLWLLVVIFPFFRYALYLFAGNYYKSGMSIFVPVTMLFMAISALSSIDNLNKINIKTLLFTTFFLFVLLHYPYFPENKNSINENIKTSISFLIIVYSLLVCFITHQKYKFFIKAMILLVLCIELVSFSSITVNKRIAVSQKEIIEKVGYNDYTVEAVNYLKSIDNNFYRITKDYSSGISIHRSLNDALIQDYYGTPSYQSFNQLNYIRFLSETNVIKGDIEGATKWAVGLESRPLLQVVTNVHYIFTKRKAFYGDLWIYNFVKTFGDVSIFKYSEFLPLGFTYDAYITLTDFKKLTDLQKDEVLFKAFVINKDEKEKYTGFNRINYDDIANNVLTLNHSREINKLREDALLIYEHNQNLFRGRIKLKAKKMLFFSIPYDNGWKVFVDGKEAMLNQVNIGFSGLLLDKGGHQIELIFEPPFLKISAIISLLGILVYLALLWSLGRIINVDVYPPDLLSYGRLSSSNYRQMEK